MVNITISDTAHAALSAAGKEDGGKPLRIAIGKKFEHELYFEAAKPGDTELDVRGLKVVIDAESTQKAEGLSIDLVPTAAGQAFRIKNPNEPPKVRRLSAPELKSMMDRKDTLRLLDVRTQGERDRARIEGAILLDNELHQQLLELDKDTLLVFHCHHGMRSQAAAEYFVEKGFRNIYNLEGGIAAWSQLVDPKVPSY